MTHGGFPWRNGKPSEIVDLSVNLNPLGVPEAVKELVEEAVKKEVYRYYPQIDYLCLKENIAEILDVNPSLIEVYNGVSEFLSYLPNDYSCPQPNYSEYPCRSSYMAKENDTSFSYYLKGDKVITSYPVNPTGSTIDEKEILDFLESKRELILDESFIDMSDLKSFRRLVEEYEELTVISSFTKSLSIPGLRIGFSISRKKVRLPPWRVNSIASYVFSNVDPKEIRKFLYKSKNEVKRLLEEFRRKIKAKTYESHAPFVLVELPVPTVEINKTLESYGYHIREPNGFIGLRETHARISVREESLKLADIINSISPKTFKLND
ncbi:aminotransferase class I/II-fold pyridoxal phosphate-dependent enzyme [Sulfuracidifex tepidarius]|uniref:Aminotransferase n=1 Tax=Sulfuracidifex tepidarius TaxID=1294262 RepID=A0A510DWJ0_9CREN|nr:aminotransferase class I/II-fold pyridoxal phosphate-dependent enzyme [Sulfuracidifex tepidarius]BBG24360.1 Histidinol-phosphate aminotransferase [Sulfuracidifex tepidarius]BBG27118.1 Histidinol-phosphate aminotransferase [Sulfuracidifex tepidarius]